MAKVPDQIRKAWANQNLIPVVGSGVSIGAASLPSWPDLLRLGTAYCESHLKELQRDRVSVTSLEAAIAAGELLSGFDQLQSILGGAPDGEHYQAFLDEVFSEPNVTVRDTLDALTSLAARVVVTTNYDKLLEEWKVVKDGEVANWSDPARMLSILRGGRGVIHLHGVWDRPESIIMSNADYTRIVLSHSAASVTDALFHSGVLLFVGCSLDGVQDPHLKEILNRFTTLQGPIVEGTTPHYMLVAGKPESRTKVRLRKMGIQAVTFGDSFADLPDFLRRIPEAWQAPVAAEQMRDRLRTLRGATSIDEVLQDAKFFVENVVYPGRRLRIGFALKCEEGARTVLRNRYLLPTPATHNEFSYPQTLAAWALVEGRILAFPQDWDQPCDFGLLKKLGKLERVRTALLATSGEDDPVLAEYLDPQAIRERAEAGTLTIRQIYQHWVGKQPSAHYDQFISVPIPIVDTVTNRKEPLEYGVLNIDTKEPEPLLTNRTAPYLKLVSDLIALGFQHVRQEDR